MDAIILLFSIPVCRSLPSASISENEITEWREIMKFILNCLWATVPLCYHSDPPIIVWSQTVYFLVLEKCNYNMHYTKIQHKLILNNNSIFIHFKMSFISAMAKQSLLFSWSFRNHSYMLIWCSRIISYYVIVKFIIKIENGCDA